VRSLSIEEFIQWQVIPEGVKEEEELKGDIPPGYATCNGCVKMKPIRLYYATRTHKQIAQVVEEFSKLPYAEEGVLK